MRCWISVLSGNFPFESSLIYHSSHLKFQMVQCRTSCLPALAVDTGIRNDVRHGISVFVHAPCAPGKAGLSELENFVPFVLLILQPSIRELF